MAGVRQVTRPKAADPTATKASNMTATEATDVTAAEAAHVTTAEAAHVTTTKATHVASSASAAAGLCTRGQKAAGKHRACQNHHRSSSHDILH
jgi:hypothetical protein